MKFRSERDTLADILSVTGRAAGGRSLPSVVLSGLLLRCESNQLTVTGTDLDLTIRVEEEVIGVADGSCVVPARLAADVVRSLEPGAVTVDAGEDTIEISAGRSHFTLRSFPVVEFPMKGNSPEHVASLPANVLAEGLRQVVRAASSDDARPLLTGVLFTTEQGALRLVATDSYRLALRDFAGTAGLSDGEDLLVPARALGELQRLAAVGQRVVHDGTVDVARGPQEITFTAGSAEITTRLLEGNYPDYRELIPSHYVTRLHIGKEAFLSALRRVRLLVRDNTTPVRLSIHSGGVELTVVSQDLGDANESVEGDGEGDELVIAFNPSYLIDGVEAVSSDEIVVEMADASVPAMVNGADDETFRYLLMPVRVS